MIDTDLLGQALQAAWNDICQDSDFRPDFLYEIDGKTYADFDEGNFTLLAADHYRRLVRKRLDGSVVNYRIPRRPVAFPLDKPVEA